MCSCRKYICMYALSYLLCVPFCVVVCEWCCPVAIRNCSINKTEIEIKNKHENHMVAYTEVYKSMYVCTRKYRQHLGLPKISLLYMRDAGVRGVIFGCHISRHTWILDVMAFRAAFGDTVGKLYSVSTATYTSHTPKK